jgi:hypothetical protein
MISKHNLLTHNSKTTRGIGAVLTLAATLLVFILFFDTNMLTNAHRVFFSLWSEDMIKDIYTTTYHTQYDSSFTHCTAMGYPYGEQYTYTGLQILVAAPLQLLQKMGVEDTWKASLTLINYYVIITIFLCALFLYLLFGELKLPPLPSLLGAVGITFLMPQIQRMGGHLTLAYLCIIPMALYFIAKLHNTHHWRWSVFYGILLLLSALLHPYYLTFLADISIVYLVYLFFTRKRNKWRLPIIGLHFCLQFLLPVILFFVLTSIGDTALDRTSVPDGMYYYRGRLIGLLLPFHRTLFGFYGAPLKTIMGIKAPEWETCCYIGIVALVALCVWLVQVIWDLFHLRFSRIIHPTNNPLLNLFLLASLLLLLVATVLPAIVQKHPELLNHLSFLAQLRALGRLLWLPFVTLNLFAIYQLWQWSSTTKKEGLRVTILALAIFGYCFDIYSHSFLRVWPESYPEWIDYDNKLAKNQWLQEINPDDYQAILSLPVFHVGSEHYHLHAQDGMLQTNTYVSIKTGLPLICNYSSRSSITRAYNCIELSWEPREEYRILKDLPNNKPLLIVSDPDLSQLNPNEQRILSYADSILATDKFLLYHISIDALRQLCQDYQQEHADDIKPEDIAYYTQTWDDQPQGVMNGISNQVILFYDDPVDSSWDKNLAISFWIKDYTHDLMGRIVVAVDAWTDDGNIISMAWGRAGQFINAIDGEDGHVYIPVTLPENTIKLRLAVGDPQLPPRPVAYDDLLFYPQEIGTLAP